MFEGFPRGEPFLCQKKFSFFSLKERSKENRYSIRAISSAKPLEIKDRGCSSIKLYSLQKKG